MRRLVLILVCLLAVFTFMVAADPLYKWVDEQGNVHYSDKPQPGAQKIVLPKAATFAAPKAAQFAPLPDNSRPQQQDGAYTQILISSPKDQDTLWNTDTATVSVTLTPALQQGDTVTFSVDGATQTVSGTSASFDKLDRGEHHVTVTVNGRGGTLTAQSVFYLQRSGAKRPPL